MTVTTLKYSNSNDQTNYKLESLGIIRTNEEMILKSYCHNKKEEQN